MKFRIMGNSGVHVSVIGLGTNRFGTDSVNQATVNNIIASCMDLGINFIDTADVYTNGRQFGVCQTLQLCCLSFFKSNNELSTCFARLKDI
jgi:aryl-alcohol dehydrogenase-like predicted oxidoreductase